MVLLLLPLVVVVISGMDSSGHSHRFRRCHDDLLQQPHTHMYTHNAHLFIHNQVMHNKARITNENVTYSSFSCDYMDVKSIKRMKAKNNFNGRVRNILANKISKICSWKLEFEAWKEKSNRRILQSMQFIQNTRQWYTRFSGF